MGEIEVGEYIRTRDGLIGKYYINKNSFNVIKINGKEIGFDIDNDIVKHSKNIIDLIEVGDIVIHGDKFISPMEDEVLLEYFKEAYTYWKGKKAFYIKSILTHEQYESMCYKVEE